MVLLSVLCSGGINTEVVLTFLIPQPCLLLVNHLRLLSVFPPCCLFIHWALSLYTLSQTNTHNLVIPHAHISLHKHTALLKHFETCRAWQHRFNHRPAIQSQSNINSAINSDLDLLCLQTMYYTQKCVFVFWLWSLGLGLSRQGKE